MRDRSVLEVELNAAIQICSGESGVVGHHLNKDICFFLGIHIQNFHLHSLSEQNSKTTHLNIPRVLGERCCPSTRSNQLRPQCQLQCRPLFWATCGPSPGNIYCITTAEIFHAFRPASCTGEALSTNLLAFLVNESLDILLSGIVFEIFLFPQE